MGSTPVGGSENWRVAGGGWQNNPAEISKGRWMPDFPANQNYNTVLERDWLSAARFEHLLDSVRVMVIIGQYASFCAHCCDALC